MAGEKTEKATPKRKQDERKKGNVLQSREVVTVISLLVTFFALKTLAPLIVEQISLSFHKFWTLGATVDSLTPSDMKKIFVDSVIIYGISAMPLLLIAGLISIVITFAQTKMLVSGKALEFKFSRLNPLQGIKKLFSLRGIVELIKAMIKISVLGVVIYNVIIDKIPYLPKLMDATPLQAVNFLGDTIMSVVYTTAAIFAILAIADYVYQWWEYEKNLRMSKDEIKEEYKMTEGDPQVKGRLKEKQRAMANSRMMQAVPTADVVIRNPTHYAIAIKYDPKVNAAPVVVAKGADHMALKIIEVAEAANVVITENRPLARGLYEAVDLDREIPEQFFQAVAEVLAFVYSLKKKDLS